LASVHHRAATVPVILALVDILPVSVTVIAVAPDASRYCSARFRFGDFASMSVPIGASPVGVKTR
jgi:hypothetical protein